jgi:hypothetical protein
MTDFEHSSISEILARKSEGRRVMQKLSMAEKIMRMEDLHDRLSPFKALRDNRVSIARKDLAASGPVMGASRDALM